MMCQVKEWELRSSANIPISGARLGRLAAGLVLYGISIALMLRAGLGVDSWDVLHQGLALATGVPFGRVVIAVSVMVLVLWVPLRQRPGVGTLANAVVVGLVADSALGVLNPARGIGAQLLVLSVGIVANGVATGLYIGAGLGPGPRDGLMTGLAARTRRSIRSVRTLIEISVLAVGWAFGGQVGLGTLLYAGVIGPLSQYFIQRLSMDRPSGGNREPAPSALPTSARSKVPASC
jgi:uncharacterized membrane protein YczE